MLTFRQLEAFYWAAKLGNFTRAAQRMKVTQSAVSLRIGELEQILGVELFHRGRRNPVMTHRGEEMLKFAEQILRLGTEAQERVSRAELVPDFLRIGFAEVISYTWLSKFVETVRQKYPKTSFFLEEALVEEVFASLKRGSIDLALVADIPAGQDVHAVPLGSVEFAFMASPLLGVPKRRCKPSDLRKWPIITLSNKSIIFAMINDWFGQGGAQAGSSYTCKSIHVAGVLARRGLGVALLPVRLYAQDIRRKTLSVIAVDPPLPALKFAALSSISNLDPFIREVANLAALASDFEK
ncbi:MAG: LysR family transcriptional regulator [Bradyrhizobiaceae bacterium]|nr:MAG: LysR family transcriptional regulator [Bradyrhizobiaceae bacterium]